MTDKINFLPSLTRLEYTEQTNDLLDSLKDAARLVMRSVDEIQEFWAEEEEEYLDPIPDPKSEQQRTEGTLDRQLYKWEDEIDHIHCLLDLTILAGLKALAEKAKEAAEKAEE
jgi:uncharacterized protein Yka (UPF0111/DUF47 family)